MKKVKPVTACMVCLFAIMPFFYSGCASIMGGGSQDKSEREPSIRWGYFIADCLLTGLVGLIIDFSDGAIYTPKPGEHKKIKSDWSELNKEMLNALNKGMPTYVVKKDGSIYDVKLSQGDKLQMIKISESQLPPKVVASLHLAMVH